MRSLDYFWLQDQQQIFIARCQLQTSEVVGRLSYVLCGSGKVAFAGRRYAKVSFKRPAVPPDLTMVCDLPRDTCLAIPESAIVGAICPRNEFPRLRDHISGRVATFLDTFVKETHLPERDVAVIGSQLFRGSQNREIGDVDVAIYGEEHIEMLRDFVQRLSCRGLIRKLPLNRDYDDRWRAEFFRMSPPGVERLRAAQWFRKLLWSGLLVTLCFAPRHSYKMSFTLLGQEAEVTGWIVGDRDAYLPPFLYQVEPSGRNDVELCASFAWCFRHAFAVGERIAARGTVAHVNGKRCLWVWRNGHYIRPT